MDPRDFEGERRIKMKTMDEAGLVRIAHDKIKQGRPLTAVLDQLARAGISAGIWRRITYKEVVA